MHGAIVYGAVAAAVQAAAAPHLGDDVRLGVQVLAEALAAPMRQLLQNAGVRPPAVIIDRVAAGGPAMTYDWEQGAVVDAHAAGVVDAAGVLATVLQTAASGALMALSTDAIVYHKNPAQSMEP